MDKDLTGGGWEAKAERRLEKGGRTLEGNWIKGGWNSEGRWKEVGWKSDGGRKEGERKADGRRMEGYFYLCQDYFVFLHELWTQK